MTFGNIGLFIAILLLNILPYYGFHVFYCLIPMILFGISYSLAFSTIWPVFPIIVDKKYLGIALGFN